MYVAVKGGERAIDAAHDWLAEVRRGDPSVASLSVAQIREQLTLAVNRVMAEGSLYDPDLADGSAEDKAVSYALALGRPVMLIHPETLKTKWLNVPTEKAPG